MPKILLTKFYKPQILKQKFSKPLEIFSQDFIQTQVIPLEEIQKKLKREQKFIVTSKIAAKHILPLSLSGTFYCVGKTSAQLLSNAGHSVVTTQPDAESLSQWLLKNTTTKSTIIYFCSEIRQPTIAEALQESHIQLKEIITYYTFSQSIKLNQDYDAYAFFSPSGVKSFLKENKIPKKSVIFAIGKTTAQALEKKGITQVEIPKEPDADNLFKKIEEYYGNQK